MKQESRANSGAKAGGGAASPLSGTAATAVQGPAASDGRSDTPRSRSEPAPRRRARRHDTAGPARDGAPWWHTVVLILISLATLTWTLPRQIQAGDAGEFSTVLLMGGVPHPSGYPWMRLFGFLARPLWELGVPPTIAAALGPALCSIAALAILHSSLSKVVRPGIALPVLLAFGCSPLVLLHTHDAEVWGPLLLFASMTVALCLRSNAHPLWLGVAVGCATSHHLTGLLLLPLAIGAAFVPAAVMRSRLGLSGIWDPARRRASQGAALAPTAKNLHESLQSPSAFRLSGGDVARVLALGGVGVLLGLCAYLSLFLGRGEGWRWGDLSSLSGWLHHVTRGDYGSLQLSLQQVDAPLTAKLARALVRIGATAGMGLEIGAIGTAILLTALAAVFLALPCPRLDLRVRVGLVLSLLLTTLVFPGIGNLDPTSPFAAWILERFDLLPSFLWLVPLAVCIDALVARETHAAQGHPAAEGDVVPTLSSAAIYTPSAGEHAASPFARLFPVVSLALFVGAPTQLMRSYAHGVPSDESGVEMYAVDVLQTPTDDRALIFGVDDHRTFPILYVREVLRGSQGPVYVDASLLRHHWYRAWLRRSWPELPDVERPIELMLALWADPTLRDTPLYLTAVFSRPAASLDLVPEGVLLRVRPPHSDASDWTPERIAARHVRASSRYTAIASSFIARDGLVGHPWSGDLWASYHDNFNDLAEAFRKQQREDLAIQVEQSYGRMLR